MTENQSSAAANINPAENRGNGKEKWAVNFRDRSDEFRAKQKKQPSTEQVTPPHTTHEQAKLAFMVGAAAAVEQAADSPKEDEKKKGSGESGPLSVDSVSSSAAPAPETSTLVTGKTKKQKKKKKKKKKNSGVDGPEAVAEFDSTSGGRATAAEQATASLQEDEKKKGSDEDGPVSLDSASSSAAPALKISTLVTGKRKKKKKKNSPVDGPEEVAELDPTPGGGAAAEQPLHSPEKNEKQNKKNKKKKKNKKNKKKGGGGEQLVIAAVDPKQNIADDLTKCAPNLCSSRGINLFPALSNDDGSSEVRPKTLTKQAEAKEEPLKCLSPWQRFLITMQSSFTVPNSQTVIAEEEKLGETAKDGSARPEQLTVNKDPNEIFLTRRYDAFLARAEMGRCYIHSNLAKGPVEYVTCDKKSP